MEPCVFPVFILPVVWNMCENLHFQRARYTTAKNTIDRQCQYRAGAAVRILFTFFQEVMGYCKSHCGSMVIDNLFFFTHTNFCCAQAF